MYLAHQTAPIWPEAEDRAEKTSPITSETKTIPLHQRPGDAEEAIFEQLVPTRPDPQIVERALAAPPVDTEFVLGRWHRDRISPKGVWLEAKVRAKAAIAPKNQTVRKFLIIGRARSGTTLLNTLLNAHPSVTCEGEVMHTRKLDPFAYLQSLASKSSSQVWGGKILSYQMVQVQRFRDPVKFLSKLHAEGFQLIHLVRDTFDQTLSLQMAQSSGRYASNQAKTGGKPDRVIDPKDFVKRLKWSEMLLEYERHCLADLPHLNISYEAHLRDETRRGRSMNLLFEYLGLPESHVRSPLQKVLPRRAETLLDNFEEIALAMKQAGLAHLLPDR